MQRQFEQKKIVVADDDELLTENLNRLEMEEGTARTMDAAIEVLKGVGGEREEQAS
jgi:hypothetical protein